MTFVPCSQCARHLRAGEAACPFCGVRVERAAARRRAAVLAMAVATAALTGCPRQSAPKYGGPPPPDSTASAEETSPEVDPPSEQPSAQPTAEPRDAVEAYGAPSPPEPKP